MASEPLISKPGVLFISTPSGGMLMDLQADRFIALSPLSAMIWSGLAAGHGTSGVVRDIAERKGGDVAQAEAVLRGQLDRWDAAGLLNRHEAVGPLPQAKANHVPLPSEIALDEVLREPIRLGLVTQLYLVERWYRRAVARSGFAQTLVNLQREGSASGRDIQGAMFRTVRNYHALRRAFRQGRTARDCLFRSLALAAVLRRQGVPADLCVGIIDLPFSSHAWVEAGGLVLNETLHERNRYQIMARF